MLINYYGPNLETQQVSVLDELTKVLSNLELKENTNLILGGDFNLILNLNLDADGGNPTLNPISTGGRCFPHKFCLPVDNFFNSGSIATKFGDFS